MTYTLSPPKLLGYTPVDKLGRENVGLRLKRGEGCMGMHIATITMVTCFLIVTTAQLLPLLCNMLLQHGIILFGERTQNTVFDSLMGKDKIISATPISAGTREQWPTMDLGFLSGNPTDRLLRLTASHFSHPTHI